MAQQNLEQVPFGGGKPYLAPNVLVSNGDSSAGGQVNGGRLQVDDGQLDGVVGSAEQRTHPGRGMRRGGG